MTTLSQRVRQQLPWHLAQALRLGATAKHHLVRSGWLNSFLKRQPIDRNGNPLPWLTYPFSRFAEQRTPADATVFEYGMGNSSLWWAKRVAFVGAVENHQGWLDRLTPRLPANVKATFAPSESDEYISGATRSGRSYDIIVVDGRQRSKCAAAAVSALTERGVIVWDNAEREKYAAGQQHLLDLGFRRLDFDGMAPQHGYVERTTVFYRDGNCFGL